MNLFIMPICLLIFSFLLQPGVSLGIPVQVDLVFPRNNTVYQPVNPFPLVFALHNFSAAWKYRPTLRYVLYAFNSEIDKDTTIADSAIIGWDEKQTQINWTAPTENKILAINSSEWVGLHNASYWMLWYRFFMDTQECGGEFYQSGKIFFNVSNTTGIMPDFRSNTSCFDPMGAITLEVQDENKDKCFISKDPVPGPISCAYTLDAEAAAQISSEMANKSRCGNVMWPNGTGIGRRCEQRLSLTSESSILRWNSFAAGFLLMIYVAISTI
jgi:hypothetical protein